MNDYERNDDKLNSFDQDTYRYAAETYPENEPGRRRVVGVAAVLLSVAVLLSALAGTIWLLLNSRVALPLSIEKQTERNLDKVEQEPSELRMEYLLADVNAQNKHFSLEEAASLASTDEKSSLSIRDIAVLVKPAVVAISTDISVQNYLGDVYQAQAAGSGFVISDDGYLVTNAHVVDNASGIKVHLEDGRTFDAALVGADSFTDIAVLRIDADNLTTVTLGDSDRLEVGELAVAIGNPTGRLSGTVTAGILSALDRRVGNFPLSLIQTDATINHGNSGGALINSFGEVVGINTLKISTQFSGLSTNTYEGLNFAIPINEAKPIVEALIQEGRVRRATIGIEVINVTDDMAEMRPELTPGVFVKSVDPRSAAADAGFQIGDEIVRFNGVLVMDSDQLRSIRDEIEIGEMVEVIVRRDRNDLALQLEIREG